MKEEEVLRTAAGLVRKGWIQKAFRHQQDNGQQCYCAKGAVIIALGGDPEDCAILQESLIFSSTYERLEAVALAELRTLLGYEYNSNEGCAICVHPSRIFAAAASSTPSSVSGISTLFMSCPFMWEDRTFVRHEYA